MAYETIIRMIRKDVNKLKDVVIPALKAEIEELKKPKTAVKPMSGKGGKK